MVEFLTAVLMIVGQGGGGDRGNCTVKNAFTSLSLSFSLSLPGQRYYDDVLAQ